MRHQPSAWSTALRGTLAKPFRIAEPFAKAIAVDFEVEPEMPTGASAPMRPICVVAACAPHSMYVEYIPLRCSAAPSSWTTWTPNLSAGPPVAPLSCRLFTS